MSGHQIVRVVVVIKSDFSEIDDMMTVAQALDVARVSRISVLGQTAL
ncbi:MAG: hypothetical protein ACJAWL_000782 [Motiliproteus sp.]|jgi:hypothetical protein